MLVVASSIGWALAVVFLPSSLDGGSAALLGVDMLAVATVVVGGLLVSRSSWARRLGLALATFQLLGLAVLPVGWLTVVAAGLSIAAAVCLGGPWLRSWVRDTSRVTSPPWVAAMLALGLLVEPGLLALAAREGLTSGVLALALLCFGLSWAYAKAIGWVIWVIRFGLVPLTALAVFRAPTMTAAFIVLYSSAIAALAWTTPARLAASPPRPRPGTVVPIPPDLGVTLPRQDPS